MVKDLTQGKPSKVILMFSLPLLLSMVFQQFYNMADSIIAGKMISNNALAAIGVSTPVTMIYVAIAVGCSGGISVVVANLFGQHKFRSVKTASSTALAFMFALAAVLTLVGYFISTPLVKLLQTPASIQEDSSAYLEIYTLGLIFVFIYNASNAVFTGMGDSITPLILLVCSSVGNVILDIVMAKPLGVAGLAYATLIAQAVAGIVAFILVIVKMKKLSDGDEADQPRLPYLKRTFNGMILLSILAISVPGVCQQSFVSVGQLLVQGLINGFGEQTIAAYTAAMKINTFCIQCIVTTANAVAAFTAQNMGAGDLKRVKQGMHSATVMLCTFALIIIAIVAIFAKPLTGFFINNEADSSISSAAVIDTGAKFLWITCPFYVFIAVKTTADGVIKGAGKLFQFMVSTCVDLVLRVALCYALAPSLDFLGICIAWPIGWVIGTAIAVGFYLSKGWQKSKFAVSA